MTTFQARVLAARRNRTVSIDEARGTFVTDLFNGSSACALAGTCPIQETNEDGITEVTVQEPSTPHARPHDDGTVAPSVRLRPAAVRTLQEELIAEIGFGLLDLN